MPVPDWSPVGRGLEDPRAASGHNVGRTWSSSYPHPPPGARQARPGNLPRHSPFQTLRRGITSCLAAPKAQVRLLGSKSRGPPVGVAKGDVGTTRQRPWREKTPMTSAHFQRPVPSGIAGSGGQGGRGKRGRGGFFFSFFFSKFHAKS